MRASIIKNSTVLLCGLLIEWWLVGYIRLNFPRILGFPLNIEGLLLAGLILAVLILAEKSFLRANPDSTVFKLTVFGATICFLAEVVFQAIRQPFLTAETMNERFHYFLPGVVSVSIFGAAISFFVAFQLKTKKTGQLTMIIIGFIIMFNVVKRYFPALL